MKNNRYLLRNLTILVGLIFIGRLFYLQILDDSYEKLSNNNAIKIKYDYPERGYVFDRNNTLLVANQSSYDIMVIPNEVKKLDTLAFCKILNIPKESFDKRLGKAIHYSRRIPSVFLKQLSKEDFGALQEVMHKFRGFYMQKRILRNYPINSAANVLGYISEINVEQLKKQDYYQQGELIGASGIEKIYEPILRGTKGIKHIQRNRFNKDIGPYKNGLLDTKAKDGQDITLTLDSKLQRYGEALMKNKRGGIVAIEPSTGEILALVTAPSYNPNILVGRERSKNFTKLYYDSINKPLYDRGLLAQYPPGSPFKLANALIGLQEKIITPNTTFKRFHGYRYGQRENAFMKCHCGIFNSPINLDLGIYRSCNSYFSNVYRRIIEKYPTPSQGMDAWKAHLESLGFGNYLGYDLPAGAKGLIPSSSYYNHYYPLRNWRAVTTISNAIGQGEILSTPIQLANFTALIANRGFYYTPHIVKQIKDSILNPKFTTPHYSDIDKANFEPVIQGMYDVFEKRGTARFYKIKNISICGKTGTAENFKRVNGKKIQFEDHSIFIAFAPKDNPKIAIAVFVENGGFGSTIAAPMASLMVEKYLKGKVERPILEDVLMRRDLEPLYKKQLEIEQQQLAQKK